MLFDKSKTKEMENNYSELIFERTIGGTNSDYGKSIAVDSENNLVVVGDTFSKDFPVVEADNSSLNGEKDIFI